MKALLPLLALTCHPPCLRADPGPWKFDFGSGPPAEGFTAVRAGDRYDAEKGHGFDLAGSPADAAGHVTGRGGYYFSLAVPEGCYRVTISPAKGADLAVKAESRRLMLSNATGPESFTVHVRRPAFPGVTVRLKDREKPYLHWDGKLTFEFNGPAPDLDRLVAIVKEVRKLGGQPVLVTSVERSGGVKKDTLGGYPDAVRSVAAELDVPLIDLHAMSRVFYQALDDRLMTAFQDGTHHNNYGSYELAKCVVEGIRTKVPDLAKVLRPGVKPFDPAKPDMPEAFRYPPSPLKDLTKPDGH